MSMQFGDLFSYDWYEECENMSDSKRLHILHDNNKLKKFIAKANECVDKKDYSRALSLFKMYLYFRPLDEIIDKVVEIYKLMKNPGESANWVLLQEELKENKYNFDHEYEFTVDKILKMEYDNRYKNRIIMAKQELENVRKMEFKFKLLKEQIKNYNYNLKVETDPLVKTELLNLVCELLDNV